MLKLIIKSKNYVAETRTTIKLDSIESGTYNDKEDRILLDMKSGRQHQVYSHDKVYIKDTENNITTEIKVSEIEDYI